MVVWRMANKDVLKFDAIFAMKAVEFLNYALLIHDILEAERMEAERMRPQVGHFACRVTFTSMEFDVFVGGSGKKLTDLQKEALADFGVSLADGAIENKSYALVTKWLEGVVRLAKQNLANANAIASNSLAQSIVVEPITLTDSSFVVAIKANDYWKFVDLGVKGTQKSNRAPNSPFRFKGNPIPIRPIRRVDCVQGNSVAGQG
jgi:hypothetical protein